MPKKKRYKVTLTDKNNPNEKVVISFIDGTFSIDRVTKTKTKTNINFETK
jgi:hypothetical protein